MSDLLIQQTDAIFAPWDQPDSPGCAVGIILDGEPVYVRGFGSANLEHRIPITGATVFDIASTSKQFTAASIALLAEEGRLGIDDDIRVHLPELPDLGHIISIRHLLHHTSGWRDYLTLLELAGYREADYTSDAEVMAFLTRQRSLNFPPGERYDYSNTGYYLLGIIVERTTGHTLAKYADAHIFGPLGMTHTWFQDDHTRIVPLRATGYSPRAEGGYRIDTTTLDMVGDGAVMTCVNDLLLWDRNFYDNKLGAGSQALIDLMTTPGHINSGDVVDYGFGLDLAPYNGLPVVSHGGWFVGYRSEMMRFPAERFTIICLANSSAINPTSLCARIADLWLGAAFDEAILAEANVEDESVVGVQSDSTLASGLFFDEVTLRIVELMANMGQQIADFGTGPRPLSRVGPGRWRTGDEAYDILALDGRLEVTHHGRPYASCQPVERATPTPLELGQMAGAYFNDELDVTYDLRLKGDELWLQYGRVDPAPLTPAAAGMMRQGDRTLSFVANDDGTMTGFTLSVDRAWGFWFRRLTAVRE